MSCGKQAERWLANWSISSESKAPCNSSEKKFFILCKKIFSSIKIKLESFLVWAVLGQILSGDILFAILLLQSYIDNWGHTSCRLLVLFSLLLLFPSLFWMDDILFCIRGEHESLILCTVVVQSSGEVRLSFSNSILSSTFNTWEHTSPKQTDFCLPQTSFFSYQFFFFEFDFQLHFSCPRLRFSLHC